MINCMNFRTFLFRGWLPTCLPSSS